MKLNVIYCLALLGSLFLLAACQASAPISASSAPAPSESVAERAANAVSSDGAADEPSAAIAGEPVRIESGGEVPFYARFGENETFDDGEWVTIVFYRPPACIPADFNLNQFFHFPAENSPGAFACGPATTNNLEVWQNGPETDPAPLESTMTGRGAVPVWFFSIADMDAAMADGEVTIGELAALPSRLVGEATTYEEFLRPSQSNDAPLIQYTAEGTLENGTPFRVDVSKGAPDIDNHVTIAFDS